MTIDQAVTKGIRIIDRIPDGWTKLSGALTAPKGYSWYSNGKSLWSEAYDSVLVKDPEVRA